MNKVYEVIIREYGYNEPVFLEELYTMVGGTKESVRKSVSRLANQDLLLRVKPGIYYVPRKKSILKKQVPDVNKVIERKYIQSYNREINGYITGINFANMLGLTTQTASTYTIATNKTSKNNYKLQYSRMNVVLKKPKANITESNYKIFQSLDLLEEKERVSEYSVDVIVEKLLSYLIDVKIDEAILTNYLKSYSRLTSEIIRKSGIYSEITS